MVIVDGCEQMADAHDRIPTVLRQDEWEQWTSERPEDALQLVRMCGDLLTIERTSEPWAKSRLQSA